MPTATMTSRRASAPSGTSLAAPAATHACGTKCGAKPKWGHKCPYKNGTPPKLAPSSGTALPPLSSASAANEAEQEGQQTAEAVNAIVLLSQRASKLPTVAPPPPPSVSVQMASMVRPEPAPEVDDDDDDEAEEDEAAFWLTLTLTTTTATSRVAGWQYAHS